MAHIILFATSLLVLIEGLASRAHLNSKNITRIRLTYYFGLGIFVRKYNKNK